MDLFAAPTSLDPYHFYAALRTKGGLHFHHEHDLWIACDAASVSAVLSHPDCHVRPVGEPVPQNISPGAAGEVYSHLMRMNDGARHHCPRTMLASFFVADQQESVRDMADSFRRKHEQSWDPATLSRWMFEFPVTVICRLLELPLEEEVRVASLIQEFVSCLSPLSTTKQLQTAHLAAASLQSLFQCALSHESLALSLIKAGERNISDEVLISNLIGLLSQTYEATAGLIGNCLVAFSRDPDLCSMLLQSPAGLPSLVAEVLRYDPPVQNTRRFVAAPCTVNGTPLSAGSTVLVMLASANRDPELNPGPDRFLLERPDRRFFSFGMGSHECPGQRLAASIASETLRVLLAEAATPSFALLRWTYYPSLNGRIPQFVMEALT